MRESVQRSTRRPGLAPDATLCADVTIGPGVRILHGARLIGEAGGAIRIGRDGIIMENAVIRASTKHPCTIGEPQTELVARQWLIAP